MKKLLLCFLILCVLALAALTGGLYFRRQETIAFVKSLPFAEIVISRLPSPHRDTAPAPALQTVRLTVPEGATVRQICALLAEKGVAEEAALLDAAASGDFAYDFLPPAAGDPVRLEGYLFPDTYDFYVPEDPARALNRLLANFAAKRENWLAAMEAAEAAGRDFHTVITAASLIERETDGTDQGKIASVIYNRLTGPGDRGGTYGYLQIDASLLYVLDHPAPITAQDLELDSPYNLYKYPGLPPTPISNPGAAAILAALSPEETDYYYYALAKDGRHRFFSRYRDFTAFLRGEDFSGG